MGTNTRRSDGRIGERITFEDVEDALTITIRQSIPAHQMTMLSIWLLLWMALEGVVLWVWSMEPSAGNAWLGYSIYSAFWAFFAFRIGKVWLWRRRGTERITIDDRGLTVALAFGQRGLPDFFAHGAYSLPKRIVPNPQQILRTFEQAFWSMGGETIQFEAGSRTLVVGKQLKDRDADALLKLIQSAIRRRSS